MCIIMYKPIGVPLPDRQVLERAFANNPDGIGYMFPAEGKVHIRKGYWDYNAWAKSFAYNKVFYKLVLEEIPLVVHARIATSGGVRRENCHPFPLCDDTSALTATRVICDTGVAHNGILGHPSGNLSDTQVFIRDVIGSSTYETLLLPDVKKILDYALKGDKLVLMNKDGSVSLFGDWVEGFGSKWSNFSYSYGAGIKSEVYIKCDVCNHWASTRRIDGKDVCIPCLRKRLDKFASETPSVDIGNTINTIEDPKTELSDMKDTTRRFHAPEYMRGTTYCGGITTQDVWGLCEICGKTKELFEDKNLGTVCRGCITRNQIEMGE